MDQFVMHTVLHPTGLSEDERRALDEHVRAQMQRKARETGMSLADPEAWPEPLDARHLGPVPTDDGPIDCTETTWRMATTTTQQLVEGEVRAEARDDGTWVADVPAMPIVTVWHGLDTYQVQARALDRDGQPTGMHAFLPIARDAVEIVPLPTTARVVIERLPEEEQPEEDIEVPESPRQKALHG